MQCNWLFCVIFMRRKKYRGKMARITISFSYLLSYVSLCSCSLSVCLLSVCLSVCLSLSLSLYLSLFLSLSLSLSLLISPFHLLYLSSLSFTCFPLCSFFCLIFHDLWHSAKANPLKSLIYKPLGIADFCTLDCLLFKYAHSRALHLNKKSTSFQWENT